MVCAMSIIDERRMAIPFKDMIAELRRELRYRQIIYPGLIKRGALTLTNRWPETTSIPCSE